MVELGVTAPGPPGAIVVLVVLVVDVDTITSVPTSLGQSKLCAFVRNDVCHHSLSRNAVVLEN